MRYTFQLKGLTPLLMHNDDVLWSDELEAWRKEPKNKNVSRAGDDRSPSWTWIGNLYHDGELVTIPSDNLQACLRQAGARVKLSGRKTLKEGAVSGMFFEDEYLAFTAAGKPVPHPVIFELKEEPDFREHLAAVKGMGLSLFTKRARIGQSKHVRVRPRFDDWGASGTLEVTAPEITKDVLELLFSEAGKVGLGDWRPGCKTPGRFGMFSATLKPIK